ncbi:unnamed protein product [Blepharisma stoltei]|uniref:Palmitoyltransferase n=1 Tax=Blepharisma stoltei TaxID=1481888 RepID=A0AAU9JPY0_9CILI|nr:unnamed protein product [Blepharisma stoltei]
MAQHSRSHGFSLPLHPVQVFSWIMMLFNIAVVSLVYFPSMNLYSKISFAVLFALSQIFVIFFAFRAIICDPTDPMVHEHILKIINGERDEPKGNQAFCTICCCNVSMKTKHCGQCNRCVENFDHHCVWLNNCIGKKNYHNFIKLIFALEFNMMVIFSYGVSIIVYYYNDYDSYVSDIKEVVDYADKDAFIVLTYVVTIEAMIAILVDGCLIILHVWLRSKHMTTFEYILKKRNAKKKKKVKTQVADVKENTTVLWDEVTVSYMERKNGNAKTNGKGEDIKDSPEDIITNEAVQLNSNSEGIVTIYTERWVSL